MLPTFAAALLLASSPRLAPAQDVGAIYDRIEDAVDEVKAWVDDLGGLRADPRSFGMRLVTDEAVMGAPLSALPVDTTHAVVLIHGLDEPGWIWDELAPALLDAGHTVLRFEYPNDQRIVCSADLLASHLRDLRSRGVARIDIVAHSMGGLIARDVLTRENYYDGDGTGGEMWPTVDRLIMLGTPNHGAPLAHVRVLAEWRENLVRLFRDGISTDWKIDGEGEAGRDLVPNSAFLTELNARPHPAHTQFTLIAGRITRVADDDLDSFNDRLRNAAVRSILPDRMTSWFADDVAAPTIEAFRSATDGMGDGVVAVDSVRLEGVDDFVIVAADHMSMVANIFDSDRIPPAVPLILDRLRKTAESEPDRSSAPLDNADE